LKVAFVPIRCGSKSIPFKNIKSFCGKPLVYWTLSELQNTNNIDKIVVSTDCQEIKSIVETFDLPKIEIYDRDIENATDTATTEAAMIEYISKSNLLNDDIFILVQATSPFTSKNNFNEALDLFINDNADSLLSCVRTKRFFWNKNGSPINYDYLSRPRRQDFDGLYMENGAFYINTVSGIMKNNNRLNGKIMIYEMPEYTAIEIDEPDDWMIAEQLFIRHNLQFKYPEIKLFFTDVDGTLTDAGMYYDQMGNELKKFNTHDGKGLELLRNKGIKIGIITSEKTQIVENRARKLKVDYLYQGLTNNGKLNSIKEVCKIENITLSQVAYIGDDINCKELLENVGICACPNDAQDEIKNIPQIIVLNKNGGQGAVREFINLILKINN
jgi:YrbI family 3-deoxy-D-manno-octulosonate 8-phosphate phosphatase